MSFPNVIFGDFGEEKATFASKPSDFPLGQLMILPDGRKFRLSQAGSATDLVAGNILSTTAGVAAHGNVAASGLVASATTTYNAVGNTDVYVVAGSVAMTKDMWADGYLNVQDDTGEGHVYMVKESESCAASAQVKISLYPRDGLKVAFKAGTTTCSLRKSLFKDIILADRGSIIAPLMGTSPVAVTKSYWFWLQRSGPASVETGATTLTDGAPVGCASATAGSATVIPTTATTATIVADYNIYVRDPVVGHALETVTATEFALVDVELE